MASVCFYFQVHQPYRIKRYRIFDIGHDHTYFNDQAERDTNNRRVLEKVARKCYLPANAVLLELLKAHPEFRASFSMSGVFLDQLQEFSPETLDSFKRLVDTGRVEILSETYYHSLAFLYSKEEFKKQVLFHKQKVKELFGYTPRVFRNTELIFNNEVAQAAEEMGYLGVIAEGADHILGWRSPAFLYKPAKGKNVKLLLKHYRLSDDIAFRFSSRDWAGYPLTAPQFAQWVSAVNGNGNLVNLFMDYETFGEHQWEDTGIFNFLRALPGEVLKHPDNDFVTPTEAVLRYPAAGELDVPHYVSWADIERDLSAWRSNPLQHNALESIYALEGEVLATKNQDIIRDWRKLQTSDHFYYMCTKWFADGDVHKYFNPYESPYEAFIAYMNTLNDLKIRIAEQGPSGTKAKVLA
jgi:alpha-amylase